MCVWGGGGGSYEMGAINIFLIIIVSKCKFHFRVLSVPCLQVFCIRTEFPARSTLK